MSISKDIVARELSESVPDYELAASSELYWTYTAVKADDYFTTGQTDGETYLSTDDDGAWAAGLPDKLPGVYSFGKWTITFNAYESTTDTDPYYEGMASSFTFSSGVSNTVDVNVQLAQAEGDGELYLHSITLSEEITGGYVLYYSVDGEELVEDSDKAMLSEDGITISSLTPGYYSLYVCLKGTDGVTYAETGKSGILVKGGLMTEVTGELDEITAEVGIGDVNVSYSTASVSSEEGLASALADSDISTVALQSSVTLTTYLVVEDDTTIDLGDYTIASEGTVFYIESGASLTVSAEDGGASTTASDVSVFYIADEDSDATASLTITGGSYSAVDSVIYASTGADITITGGTFEASSSGSALCAYGSGTLNISGGTFSGEVALDLNAPSSSGTPRSNNLTVNITGGTFTDAPSGSSNSASGIQPLHVKSGSITVTGGTFTNNNGSWEFLRAF